MNPINYYIDEYKKQLSKGDIKIAYKFLMQYTTGLRNYMKRKYPEYSIPGNIYNGNMDMTYFPLFPAPLKEKNLKIAVVLLHENLRFEVWLAGINKKVQSEYLRIMRLSGLNKYTIPASVKGNDYITSSVLNSNPDFSDTDALTRQLERGINEFINDISKFLSENPY